MSDQDATPLTGVEDTSRRDPAQTFLEMAAVGPDAYITGMEAAGQRQLVSSTKLPSDTFGQDEEFRAVGFVLGEPDASDPLFRDARLPDGWMKEATDHSMGSVIKDPQGRVRVRIFYKAAFYDRSANMNLVTPAAYASDLLYYADMPLVLDEWATAEEMLAGLAAMREDKAKWIGHDLDKSGHYTEAVAKIDALVARITAAGGDPR